MAVDSCVAVDASVSVTVGVAASCVGSVVSVDVGTFVQKSAASVAEITTAVATVGVGSGTLVGRANNAPKPTNAASPTPPTMPRRDHFLRFVDAGSPTGAGSKLDSPCDASTAWAAPASTAAGADLDPSTDQRSNVPRTRSTNCSPVAISRSYAATISWRSFESSFSWASSASASGVTTPNRCRRPPSTNRSHTSRTCCICCSRSARSLLTNAMELSNISRRCPSVFAAARLACSRLVSAVRDVSSCSTWSTSLMGHLQSNRNPKTELRPRSTSNPVRDKDGPPRLPHRTAATYPQP